MKQLFTFVILLASLQIFSQENCDINEDIYKADSTLIIEKLSKFFILTNDLLEAEEEELKDGIMKELLDYFPLKKDPRFRDGSVYISIPDNSRSKLSISPYEYFQSLKSSRKTEANEFLSIKATIIKNQISRLLIYPTIKNEIDLPYCIIVPCEISVLLNKNGVVKTENQKVDFYFRYNKCDIKQKEPKIFLIKNDPQFKSTLLPHKVYSAKEFAERNSKYEPYIRISVEPNDATLTLDNNTNIKNNELVKVSVGFHTITAKARNFFPKTITVNAFKSDKPVEANIKLDKKEGTITFACEDSRYWGKKIYIKKRKGFLGVGAFDNIGTLPLNNYKIPFGSYTFKFDGEECYSATNADINIEEGNPTIIHNVVFTSNYYTREATCAGLRALGLKCDNNCPKP